MHEQAYYARNDPVDTVIQNHLKIPAISTVLEMDLDMNR